MNLTLEGSEAVFARFAEIDAKLKPKALAMLADAVLDDVYRGADAHTQTGSKGGALARSVTLQKVGEGYAVGHRQQIAPYAPFVHWGAKPHLIKPKDKKMLRWPGGNGFIFSKFVNHPGYKGDPYMIEALRKAEAQHWPAILDKLQKQA